MNFVFTYVCKQTEITKTKNKNEEIKAISKVKHIRGKENHYADILSHWKLYEYSNDQKVAVLHNRQWELFDHCMFMPNFEI